MRSALPAATTAVLSLLVAVVVSALPVRAEDNAPAAGPTGVARLVTPEVGRLGNGLTVLSLVDAQSPVATLQVWYDTGSRNERPGITGITHLFEALMEQGTRKVGAGEFARQVQAAGGLADAFTSWDLTCSWISLPPGQLELAARLEADRMANLALTADHLEAARRMVQAEARYQAESQPLGQGVDLLTAQAYLASPYHWPVAGWPADVAAITLDDCRAWYALHYTPDKATVVIAGPTAHADNMKLVERTFGRLKAGPPAPRVATGEPAQQGERRARIEAATTLPILLGGYKVPPDSSSDTPVVEIIGSLLWNGPSSRLVRRLVHDDGSAVIASGFMLGRKDTGLLYVVAGARPDRDRDSLEAACFDEIARLATEPVGARELARVKNQLEAAFVASLETVNDRASAVGTAALVHGDPTAAARRIERLRAVTPEDILRVARSWLVPANRTVVWVLPRAGRSS